MYARDDRAKTAGNTCCCGAEPWPALCSEERDRKSAREQIRERPLLIRKPVGYGFVVVVVVVSSCL